MWWITWNIEGTTSELFDNETKKFIFCILAQKLKILEFFVNNTGTEKVLNGAIKPWTFNWKKFIIDFENDLNRFSMKNFGR